VLYDLYLVCFQQVYAQLPAVYLQHPFWGDVSPFSRCEAAFFESDLELDQVRTQHSDSGALWSLTLSIQEPAELV
jgi:hypothetical protein